MTGERRMCPFGQAQLSSRPALSALPRVEGRGSVKREMLPLQWGGTRITALTFRAPAALDRVHVVGVSIGDWWALRPASGHANRVSGAVRTPSGAGVVA